MKKVIQLCLIWTMIFMAVGCTPKGNEKELTIETTGQISVFVGSTVDWKEYITVKYGSDELNLDNAKIDLILGNPDNVGTCKYRISYTYSGQTKTLEVDVSYVADTTKILRIELSDASVAIGETIVPLDYVTVYYGTEILDKTKAEVSKIFGDTTQEGVVRYQVSYTYLGQNVTKTLEVTVVDTTDPKLKTLKTALSQVYDSYTFVSKYEIAADSYYVNETSKVEGEDKYQIDYEDSDGTTLDFFVHLTDEYTYVYNWEGNEYINYPLTLTQWNSKDDDGNYNYSTYFLNAVSISSLNLSVDDFEIVGEQIVCKESKLDLVGEKLFATGVDGAEFTSIVVTLQGEHIVKIDAYYDATDMYGDYTGHYSYEFSNFNETKVILPDVDPFFEKAPEHIDPNDAVELNETQKETLSTALLQQYEKYSYSYIYNESNGYNMEKENTIVDGNLYRIGYAYSGYDGYYFDQFNYYFYVDSSERYWIYEVDENKNYVATELTTQQQVNSFAPYDTQISDFEFTNSLFGYANGKYVAKPTSLDVIGGLLFDDPESSVIACELEVVENHVTNLYIVIQVDSATDGLYYYTMEYSYSDFGTTSLTVPVAGTTSLIALDQSLTTTLTNAFGKDYSNVTIYDGIFGSTFYFAGEDVHAYVTDEEGALVIDQYKIVDGKYYEVVDGVLTEILFQGSYDEVTEEGSGFTYFVPVPDFSKVDISKVQYDSLSETYYIKAEDLDISEFCFYYDMGLEILSYEFVLTLDGTIESIQILFNYEGEIYQGGLEYSDYQTTMVE